MQIHSPKGLLMKAILFDLDDTLYLEMEFVESGFRAVAHYMASKYAIDKELMLQQLLHILSRDGRGKVFDTLPSQYRLYAEDLVKTLISFFR